MAKALTFRVSLPDKKLLQRVKAIAESPAGESPEVKEQLTVLAKAIEEVAASCASLSSVFETLSKNVTLTPRK